MRSFALVFIAVALATFGTASPLVLPLDRPGDSNSARAVSHPALVHTGSLAAVRNLASRVDVDVAVGDEIDLEDDDDSSEDDEEDEGHVVVIDVGNIPNYAFGHGRVSATGNIL